MSRYRTPLIRAGHRLKSRIVREKYGQIDSEALEKAEYEQLVKRHKLATMAAEEGRRLAAAQMKPRTGSILKTEVNPETDTLLTLIPAKRYINDFQVPAHLLPNYMHESNHVQHTPEMENEILFGGHRACGLTEPCRPKKRRR